MAKRPPVPMPSDIRQRPKHENLTPAHQQQPWYQRNDYLGWISRAKQPATRTKRIDQMIDELRVGEVYMKMEHPPSAKN